MSTLDEFVSEDEMRFLIMGKAHVVSQNVNLDPAHRMSRDNLVEIVRRMLEFAEALPPDIKQ